MNSPPLLQGDERTCRRSRRFDGPGEVLTLEPLFAVQIPERHPRHHDAHVLFRRKNVHRNRGNSGHAGQTGDAVTESSEVVREHREHASTFEQPAQRERGDRNRHDPRAAGQPAAL
jgi:hypothetical protein